MRRELVEREKTLSWLSSVEGGWDLLVYCEGFDAQQPAFESRLLPHWFYDLNNNAASPCLSFPSINWK